jgi:hypothetical protein
MGWVDLIRKGGLWMTEAEEALQRFKATRETHWKNLFADSRPEADDDAESEVPLPPEDERKRVIARAEILQAWRAYVQIVGQEDWDEVEKWVRYCRADIRLTRTHDTVGDDHVPTPEFARLIERYGEECWSAHYVLVEQEAQTEDSESWPGGDSDLRVNNHPTFRDSPSGVGLIGLGRRVGGPGTVYWGMHPGAFSWDRVDGVLRMDERGIDWADRKVLRKRVYDNVPWTSITAFATKGRSIIFGAKEARRGRKVVEFEAHSEPDVIQMYSLARMAFPGPEYTNRMRLLGRKTWSPVGPRWGQHWWVWRDFDGDWIIRYLFEKDKHLL